MSELEPERVSELETERVRESNTERVRERYRSMRRTNKVKVILHLNKEPQALFGLMPLSFWLSEVRSYSFTMSSFLPRDRQNNKVSVFRLFSKN